jgi:enamine deaminase RidA (YjgF/YER057c/UK114 family)
MCSDLALFSESVEGADRLGAEDFRAAVARLYGALGDRLDRSGRAAIRLWNYLPDPSAIMGHRRDRYMVFNEGRSDGYATWRPQSCAAPPTASAVGIEGSRLVVHCLASHEPGRPVENPRQTSSWHYSDRYGPIPPRFSRAAVATIGDRPLILIGGTASIVGEDTVHVGDIVAQTDETLRNLSTLIAVACGDRDDARGLTRLRDARGSVAHSRHVMAVEERLSEGCPNLARTEFVIARLCRPDRRGGWDGGAGLGRPV